MGREEHSGLRGQCGQPLPVTSTFAWAGVRGFAPRSSPVVLSITPYLSDHTTCLLQMVFPRLLPGFVSRDHHLYNRRVLKVDWPSVCLSLLICLACPPQLLTFPGSALSRSIPA